MIGGSVIAVIGGVFSSTIYPRGIAGLALEENGTTASEQAARAKLKISQGSRLKPIAPLLTNLAEPAQAYIRVEAAILTDDKFEDGGKLTAEIGDDFLAYLRTVKLEQLEGPSGYQFLKQDLLDRARLRGGNVIHGVYFQTFIVE